MNKLLNNLLNKLYLLLLLVLSLPAFSIETSLLDSAELAYQNKDFETAIEYFQTYADKGYVSADLYYNLGNAHYKSSSMPLAILNYEKALKLEPQHEDCLHNLQLANQGILDKIETLPEPLVYRYFKQLVSLGSTNIWALVALGIFVVFLALVYRYLFARDYDTKKRAFVFAIPCFLLFLCSLYFSYFQKTVQEKQYAIMIEPYVNVKSAPESDGTDLFLIHEGLKVQVEDTDIIGWVKIKLSDGNQGWVQTDSLAKI